MHYALRGKYPIETEEHIKTAVDYFNKYLTRFNPMDRAVIAINIEKRATDLNVVLDNNWITNYSRMFKKGSMISPDFERNIELRKQACLIGNIKIKVGDKIEDAEEMLAKIATLSKDTPGIALVKVLEEFDKQANLQSHYDDDIVDPVITVFGSFVNPEYDAVKIGKKLTDYSLIKTSRNNEMLQKIASKFGDDFVNEFKKGPVEKINSLTPPEKSLFVETIA